MKANAPTPTQRLFLILVLLSGIILLPDPVPTEAYTATAGRPSASRPPRRRVRRGRLVRRRLAVREPVYGAPSGPYPIAPDKIEVFEQSAPESPSVRHLLNPPKPPPVVRAVPDPDEPIGTSRRINVRIETSRVQEIQQALLQRGVYTGELTGVYDAETIRAMRIFQAREKIPVTGYPTAHALKRLGLAN